ncbi:hypothetical protein NWE59_02120 [Mycoplasmopsis felis]|uniref:hypothetical protein n=1 Tax=Mycoplasmopsis felis TaxID=33923 RepID=UPI0021AF5CDC|nr:hypothetical protein [Mycoplasmopsis felis]UWV78859.1 hypothetical protein NWE59_02120 [Mycoplasmopsis felis]
MKIKKRKDNKKNEIDQHYTSMFDSIIQENTLPPEARLKTYKKNTKIYVISIISVILILILLGILIWQIIIVN